MAELPGYSFISSAARVWLGNTTIAQLIAGYAAETELPPTQLSTLDLIGKRAVALGTGR